ncbi:MAG: protein translocase subunit SecF [Desulfobacula sp.]|uniref:protein translocase subunit SecF n=1 Tax=Desulfobacula sp. TaxID=2593537 RepID=UPI0025C36524|nr:protein translocase subunit SecF [Desulfobacula sp.]MCD4721285.1 protein translocase subunit SecF [Desulfobacula sp.]
MQIIKSDINIDLIGKQKIGFALSLILILLSIGSLIIHKGPNFGIDFVGGTIIQIKFSQQVPVGKIRSGLSNIGFKDASVQNFGHDQDHEFLIRTSNLEMTSKGLSQSISEAIKASTGIAPEIRRVEMVGPQVGKDLRKKALLAMFYSLLFITIYISGRFELKWMLSGVTAGSLMTAVYFLSVFNVSMAVLITAALVITLALFWVLRLKYAMGAMVALLHDVLITVGIFSILNLDFSLPIIAALLTIIGYSLNDTIIVFDRIRENIKGVKTMDTFPTLFNKSINQTLSRTILTSVTTLVVLIPLYFLGGEIIHNFAFAMIIGVIIGTYSSIFVATPIVLAANKR